MKRLILAARNDYNISNYDIDSAVTKIVDYVLRNCEVFNTPIDIGSKEIDFNTSDIYYDYSDSELDICCAPKVPAEVPSNYRSGMGGGGKVMLHENKFYGYPTILIRMNLQSSGRTLNSIESAEFIVGTRFDYASMNRPSRVVLEDTVQVSLLDSPTNNLLSFDFNGCYDAVEDFLENSELRTQKVRMKTIKSMLTSAVKSIGWSKSYNRSQYTFYDEEGSEMFSISRNELDDILLDIYLNSRTDYECEMSIEEWLKSYI